MCQGRCGRERGLEGGELRRGHPLSTGGTQRCGPTLSTSSSSAEASWQLPAHSQPSVCLLVFRRGRGRVQAGVLPVLPSDAEVVPPRAPRRTREAPPGACTGCRPRPHAPRGGAPAEGGAFSSQTPPLPHPSPGRPGCRRQEARGAEKH